MAPSTRTITILLSLFTSYTSAAYYGGIAVGPFKDPTTDSAYCPSGTTVGALVVWCCPTGTVFDGSQNSGAYCCPTAADCLNDLIKSGVQCADPSMTLWKSGGSMLCCPAGYYLNDLRFCDNKGSPGLYTTTAQAAHLTIEASSPSGTEAVSSPASKSAATTGSVKASATGTGLGGATAATGSNTSSGVSAATSKAAAANLDAGLGGVLVMVGGLLFL